MYLNNYHCILKNFTLPLQYQYLLHYLFACACTLHYLSYTASKLCTIFNLLALLLQSAPVPKIVIYFSKNMAALIKQNNQIKLNLSLFF